MLQGGYASCLSKQKPHQGEAYGLALLGLWQIVTSQTAMRWFTCCIGTK
jgi:hypothetical protein